MTGNTFICYRRSDDPGTAQALFARLGTVFPAETVFMDVEGIPAGEDFATLLDAKVSNCDVLLAVIGRNWLVDENGLRRLEDPHDYVRHEIGAALDQGKRVIPVLVHGAQMPKEADLPEPIKRLAKRQALRLSHEQFGSDFRGLVDRLNEVFRQIDEQRQAHEETARREAEVARQAEEAARQAAEATRQEAAANEDERQRQEARAKAIAGLTPEQINKAEELANWDFIKASTNIPDFRDHLARFPDGVCRKMASTRLEALVWAAVPKDAGTATLSGYLTEFPDGAHRNEANARIAALQARQAAEREKERKAAEAAAAKAAAAEKVAGGGTSGAGPAPAPKPAPAKSGSGGSNFLGGLALYTVLQVISVGYHVYEYRGDPWYHGFTWPISVLFTKPAPSPLLLDPDWKKALGPSPLGTNPSPLLNPPSGGNPFLNPSK